MAMEGSNGGGGGLTGDLASLCTFSMWESLSAPESKVRLLRPPPDSLPEEEVVCDLHAELLLVTGVPKSGCFLEWISFNSSSRSRP